MKKPLYNPYLPLLEFVPDGEPHIFGDRLYIFGSHDQAHGTQFCPLDYVVYSTPLSDLSDWTYHGISYKKTQDPDNRDGSHRLNAPDVVLGNDGNYYLYYCMDLLPQISCAVADRPEGPYQFHGYVRHPDGRKLTEYMPFDPALMNDEGRILLYFGFTPPFPIHGEYDKTSPGCMFAELEEDMLTIKGDIALVIPSKKYAGGTSFHDHAYFEAPSIRFFNGLYHLVYCPIEMNQLCHATSKSPQGPFTYRGVIVSNGDIGLAEQASAPIANNHGGLVKLGHEYYIFYHRHTHGTMFSRQGCAERVIMQPDGTIDQVEITSQGLYGKRLEAKNTYPAAIACNLWGLDGAKKPVFGKKSTGAPYVTSDGDYLIIAGLESGSVVGYKYFSSTEPLQLCCTVRCDTKGYLQAFSSLQADPIAVAYIDKLPEGWCSVEFEGSFCGTFALFLRFTGEGSLDIRDLSFHEIGETECR